MLDRKDPGDVVKINVNTTYLVVGDQSFLGGVQVSTDLNRLFLVQRSGQPRSQAAVYFGHTTPFLGYEAVSQGFNSAVSFGLSILFSAYGGG